MDHLLTVASWEFDGESLWTWLPVECRTDDVVDRAWGGDARNSVGHCLGDAGGVYILECRTCPEHPVGHWFDCSRLGDTDSQASSTQPGRTSERHDPIRKASS
ncbi:hypothetical protein BGK67_31640 [Streptomyces subrutilus]|uniref:Uncharacterized protein n=1 Tax=Streptomyces subrutilus TaxID=36818 RepID=A0A1E5Q0F3_9ACTN|nr:hypothetical protein BGK67_31640 [Streptomyces subrutilus]